MTERYGIEPTCLTGNCHPVRKRWGEFKEQSQKQLVRKIKLTDV